MSFIPVHLDGGLNLIKTYWMGDEELPELIKFCNSMMNYNDKYKNSTRMKTFRKLTCISFIYTSNRLEDTLPKNSSYHDTYAILNRIFDDDDQINNENKEQWNTDGVTKCGNPSRQQMLQHIKALKYLCEEKNSDGEWRYQRDLSLDIIKETHCILMNNAVDDNGKPILAGEFRNFNVRAENYTYQPHEEVPAATIATVDRFNKAIRKETHVHPIKIVADLFYEMITIHPFGDGNGRLCRLLAAYAFYAVGVPFPVSITSGHSRSRRHYIDSILKARRIGNDRSYIHTLMCCSLFLGWKDFMNNTDAISDARVSTEVVNLHI